MGAESWALVGVVVGAVLGGIAQIVANAITAHTQRTREVRSIRRDAYAEFIRAAHTTFEARVNAAVVGKGGKRAHAELVSHYQARIAALERLTSTEVAMQDGLTRLQLVAPADTYAAASAYRKAISSLKHDDPMGAEQHASNVTAAGQAFLALAKRDLGLS